MYEKITQLMLDNGLQIMLKEIHTAPIISQWLWYRVGSRNEQPGLTGISHWVEHMQFKGTAQFPAGSLEQTIARLGGYWNAMTYIDWTTYYATMPAKDIDSVLVIEADRMLNSLFIPREVEAERMVIISERQGNENEPLFLLSEQMQAAAFNKHSYGHETIGALADLEKINRDDLYQHYKNYYAPNNAVLALAGDFDTNKIIDRIRELFAPIPSGIIPSWTPLSEPKKTEEQKINLKGPGDTTYVQLAYIVSQATHPDFYALMVLDSLLCGASSLNMFGGGISNKTSRLYQALVDGEVAVSVFGSLQATIDPFLYTILLTMHPQKNPTEAIRLVDQEILRLQQEGPKLEELNRAVKQARALFAYGSESISNQAFWMGYAQMYADYDWFLNYLENLQNVTPEQVQDAAQNYLQKSNRLQGIYSPTGNFDEN